MILKAKGCQDIYGKKAKVWQYVNQIIDMVMEEYHYDYIRTPIFEASDLFHRGIGESSDIVSKETYDFKDRGNRLLTLRPEGTAGIVRSYIENKMYAEPTQPLKVYYNGTMYRYERSQAGRYREFTQFGIEVLGTSDPMADAEVISLAVYIYRLLGLKEIKVNINSLGDKNSRDNYRQALIDYFKPQIKHLCEDCQRRLEKNPLRILDCKIDAGNEILKNAPKTIDYLNEESRQHFKKVQEYLDILEIPYEVNPNIVRGLDYYNHTVFEIEAKVEGFGSQNVIGAGGRYDGLVEELGGPKTSCVGFASGLERLILALEKENIELPIEDDVEVFVMYVNDEEKKQAVYLTQELRQAGFCCETEYTSRTLKGQLKQADRLNSKYLVFLNSADLANKLVTVKDNNTKDEEKVAVADLISYLSNKMIGPHDDCCGGHGDCHCK